MGLSDRMAEALEESYQGLEKKVSDRTRDLSALYAALAPLASTDSAQLLRQIVERLKEATGADAALIRILDKETKSLLSPAHVGFSSSYLLSTQDLDQGSAVHAALASGAPIIASDISKDPRLKGKKQIEAGFRSCAFLPFNVSGELRGIVHLASRKEGHFSLDKADHLMAIARQMGVAMENRELLAESKQRAENQAGLVKSLSLLVGASQKLVARVDIETLAQDILNTVVTSFGIRLAWIGSAEPDGRVRPLYWAGDVAEYLRHVEIRWDDSPLGQGPAGRAIRTGQPVVMDVATDPGFEPWRASALAQGYREVAAFPLIRGDKPFGHLILYSAEKDFFTSERVELLQTYANIATGALESARLFEKTKWQAQEKAALNTIATAVSQSLEVRQILNIAMDKVLEVTGRERGYIRLKDPITGTITLAAHKGISQEYADVLIHHRTTGGKTDQVFATGKSLIVNDTKETPLKGATRREGQSVMAWIPVNARGKVVGVLNISSRQPVPFSTAAVELLQAIANVIGVALENAWLYQESQRQEEIQKLLKELSQDIRSLDINSFLNKVTDKVREFFKVDIADIRLLEEGGIQPPAGASGIEAQSLHGVGGLTGRLGWIVKHRRPAVIADTQIETDIPAGDTVRGLGVRGYLGVPLFSRQGEVIGILRALTYEPREFRESEVDLLQQLANGAAIALTNARLFEETERRAREQAAVNAISMALTQSLHVDELLKIALSKVLEVTGRNRGSIKVKDRATGRIVLAAHQGLSQEYVNIIRSHLSSEEKASEIFESGEVVIVNDPEKSLFDLSTHEEGLRSLIWVPLKTRGTVVGILNVSTPQSNPFTPREIEILKTVGNVIGIAVENARLFQESERNLGRIRALREIDQAISSTLDLRNVLDILLEKIDLTLPYASATIRLFNKEKGLLEPVACRNLDEEEWKTSQWSGGRGIANVVFETKNPLIIRNALDDPRVLDTEFYRKHNLCSYVGVPLIVKDESLGVLGFYTKEEHEFTGEEVDFLSTLAGQAAIAIHNSQLYENTRLREAQLKESNRMLSALHAVAAAASQSLDLDRVFQSAIAKITEIFDFDATQIHICNERTGELLFRAGFEKDPDRFMPVHSFKRGEGVVGAVAESGKPMIFEDVQTSPLYQQLSRSRTSGKSGYHLFAVFPIRGKLRNAGTLACTGIDPRKLTSGEIQLLEAMADQIAVAIENGELYERLKQKIEELQEANKVKDEFLSVMSHELRTPLNVVMGYAAMIKDEMLGGVNTEQKRALEKVISRSTDLLNMITSILYATSIEAKKVQVQNSEFGLSDLLDELKIIYDISLNKPIKLDWDYAPGLPRVFLDRDKVRVVLQKLIDNAAKFTETGGVTVSARLSESRKQNPENSRRAAPLPDPANGWLFLEPPWLEVKVTDTGVGIAGEKLPIIFDRFRQADSSETRRYSGVGLGLYIAKHFTELLGGKIDVETEEGKGSIFTVRVPCPIVSSMAPNPGKEKDAIGGHVSQIR